MRKKREKRQEHPWPSATYPPLSSWFPGKKFFFSFPKTSFSPQTSSISLGFFLGVSSAIISPSSAVTIQLTIPLPKTFSWPFFLFHCRAFFCLCFHLSVLTKFLHSLSLLPTHSQPTDAVCCLHHSTDALETNVCDALPTALPRSTFNRPPVPIRHCPECQKIEVRSKNNQYPELSYNIVKGQQWKTDKIWSKSVVS